MFIQMTEGRSQKNKHKKLALGGYRRGWEEATDMEERNE